MNRTHIGPGKPQWRNDSLDSHYRKHGVEVAQALGCRQDSFNRKAYADASKSTATCAQFEFLAEKWERAQRKHPRSRYFVDVKLLQAITDPDAFQFYTYFPLSLGWRSLQPADLAKMTEGDRLLAYRRYLKELIESEILKDVQFANGAA